jgi:hypothetical protein
MTLDELDHKLPNGFHDAHVSSISLNYVEGVAQLRLSLLVGWPDDPEPQRNQYQEAILTVTELCFCSIEPPSSKYPVIPNGKPLRVNGDPAKPDHLPSLPKLSVKFPTGTWCYRFFVQDWNAFIHIAARDAQLAWIGTPPQHDESGSPQGG